MEKFVRIRVPTTGMRGKQIVDAAAFEHTGRLKGRACVPNEFELPFRINRIVSTTKDVNLRGNIVVVGIHPTDLKILIVIRSIEQVSSLGGLMNHAR